MPNILVTDDNDAFRTMVVMALTGEGYHVYEARHGKEALHYLSTEKIDLVLLDLIMPEMEGIETIQQMGHQFSEVPVITMSGDTARMETELFLKITQHLGAKTTLKKPFRIKELLQKVQSHLNG